ncbi:MAG: hypothetical protein RL650_1846 [Pseudomonadota bacterium]
MSYALELKDLRKNFGKTEIIPLQVNVLPSLALMAQVNLPCST